MQPLQDPPNTHTHTQAAMTPLHLSRVSDVTHSQMNAINLCSPRGGRENDEHPPPLSVGYCWISDLHPPLELSQQDSDSLFKLMRKWVNGSHDQQIMCVRVCFYGDLVCTLVHRGGVVTAGG